MGTRARERSRAVMTWGVRNGRDPRTGTPGPPPVQRTGQGCVGDVTGNPKFQENFSILLNSLSDRTRLGTAFAAWLNGTPLTNEAGGDGRSAGRQRRGNDRDQGAFGDAYGIERRYEDSELLSRDLPDTRAG